VTSLNPLQNLHGEDLHAKFLITYTLT